MSVRMNDAVCRHSPKILVEVGRPATTHALGRNMHLLKQINFLSVLMGTPAHSTVVWPLLEGQTLIGRQGTAMHMDRLSHHISLVLHPRM